MDCAVMPEVGYLYTGEGSECQQNAVLAVWSVNAFFFWPNFGKVPRGLITLEVIYSTNKTRKCKCPQYIHAHVDMQ